MEYGGLNCQGTESSLDECAVSLSFVETWSNIYYCNQRDNAGVRCTPRMYGKLYVGTHQTGAYKCCKSASQHS